MADIKHEIESAAITLVKLEKQAWETGTCFVTEKVAFQMRNLIRQLRKNYYGIFDKPKDEQTGRDKIWPPLSESLVESVLKNIDLDTKDIGFRAKKRSAIPLASLVRNIVKNELDRIFFGETLDDAERTLAIDGTVVWKTVEEQDPETKRPRVKIRPVDLLNFYIDPVSHSIKETGAVIERVVMPVDEFKQMPGLVNTEKIIGRANVNLYDGDVPLSGGQNQGGATLYAEFFERWGKMPKFLMTGDPKDKDEQIEGHIICSLSAGAWVVHLIEDNPTSKKPYEEAWYTRVPGRWYGKGVCEKALWLQLWLNIIVNIRITRSLVSQLGIFKIKRGAGVTPQMISRLTANGVLMVNNIDDVQQMVVQEASQASYTDEANIQTWAQRVTSAFESVTGESLPASTTATTAAIQSRSGQSQFVLIKKGIGMFLQRWIKRQALPIIQRTTRLKDIIRITGENEELKTLDELYVNKLLAEKIGAMNELGIFLNPVQVELEKQKILADLQKDGKDRFVKILHDIPFDEYDVQVYITNEEIDKAVLLQNLIQTLQLAPEFKDNILRTIYDVMGLDVALLKVSQPMGGPTPSGPQVPGATPTGSQNPQKVVTQANTMQNAG